LAAELQGREVISGEFGAPKWDGCIVVGQLLAIWAFYCKMSFKVKVVGSPPTLAQRVLNETLWNPAFFYCWGIEAAQGWGGRVSGTLVIVAKCRHLGVSLSSGLLGLWPRPSGRYYVTLSRFARLEPWVSNHSFGVTSERDLLAFTSSRFSGVLIWVLFCSLP